MSAPLAIMHLLDTLEVLGRITRHLHPSQLDRLVPMLGHRDAKLREALADAVWPAPVREPIGRAADATLRACEGLRGAADDGDGLRLASRALRQVAHAQEALYPLAAMLPAVHRFFLSSDQLTVGEPKTDQPTGVMHAGNDTTERGGFSLYIPEDYDASRRYPLVMALHGGSGHGRLFLWSWLREVRGRGVILAAPTAVGSTWSLMEPEVDSGNLSRVLDQINQRWPLDPARLLLTGMSDGGTFTLLSGLDEASPFTHLAPFACSFHPLLLTMTDPRRMAGLPVYLVHGALDWMFPVSMARTAHPALAAAGAAVIYREIADLSHVYPREEGVRVLDWLLAA